MVQDDERRGRLADLIAAIEDGERRREDEAQALEEILELGLSDRPRPRRSTAPKASRPRSRLTASSPAAASSPRARRRSPQALSALTGSARAGLARSRPARARTSLARRRRISSCPCDSIAPAPASTQSASRPHPEGEPRGLRHRASPASTTKDKSCIDVCPVDCIHEADKMLVIDPEECIDCGACEPECPVEAITPQDARSCRVGAVRRDQRGLEPRRQRSRRDDIGGTCPEATTWRASTSRDGAASSSAAVTSRTRRPRAPRLRRARDGRRARVRGRVAPSARSSWSEAPMHETTSAATGSSSRRPRPRLNVTCSTTASGSGCSATSRTIRISAPSSSPRCTATGRSRLRSRPAAPRPRSHSVWRRHRRALDAEVRELAEELRALRPWAKESLATYEERRDFFAANSSTEAPR